MTSNELMKTSYAAQPAYGRKELQALKDSLNGFSIDARKRLYLLYSREDGYFTLFERDPKCSEGGFGQEVVETILLSLGEIVHAQPQEQDDAYEFWIRPNAETEPSFYLLMNWDQAVVKFHG